MALAVADERLLAREHELNRPPGLPDEEAEQALDGDVFLPAEAAAQVRALDPDAAVREIQHVGHVAEVLQHLGADAQDDDALGVDPADAGLRLHVRVVDEGRVVGVLDRHVRAPKALVDVAAAKAPSVEEVPAGVDLRRARGERLQRVVDARQLLVLDAHELGGQSGRLRRLGRDRDHGLSLEAHAVFAQYRLERRPAPPPSPRPSGPAAPSASRSGARRHA